MLLSYLKAIREEWFSLISGALGVLLWVLGFVAETAGWSEWTKRSFWITSSFAVGAAGYRVWKVEREKRIAIQNKIEAFPDLRITPDAFHQDRFRLQFPGAGFEWSVLRLNILNEPRTLGPSSSATQVSASLFFYNDRGDYLFQLRGARWEGTAQPPQRDPNTDLNEILTVSILPGTQRTVNIVCKPLDGEACFGVNNAAYEHLLQPPYARMAVGRFCCRLELRGVNVRSDFQLEFENKGAGLDLVPIRTYKKPAS